MNFSLLMTPGHIGKLELKNRFIMAPMGHGFCDEDECYVNDRLIEFFRQRALGGYALIDVGAVQIDPLLNTNAGILKLYDDSYIPGMQRLTQAVHEAGGKIMAQLLHQGRYCSSREYGQPGVAPSAVYSRYTGETPREMTTDEVETMVGYYRDAAGRVVKSGFDAVEICTNSGYLIGQFLSPLTNLRTDKYGGKTLEERMTFMFEVIAAVRGAVGDDYPIVLRICSNDMVEGSNTNESACKIAAAAEKAGVDAIHVTGGWHEATIPQTTMDIPHGAFLMYGKRIKESVNIPVIQCNRMDVATAEQAIYEGVIDFASFARQSLADAEMPIKTAACRTREIRPCISCNQGCLDMRMKHRKITCLVNAEVGREVDLIKDGLLPTQRQSGAPEKILVIGSGPAGMEFARVAALRGHEVTIWEEADHMGGQFEVNSAPPGRHDFADFERYLENECRRLGVSICLSKSASAEMVLSAVNAGLFDRVVVATGARPTVPPIPGADGPNVCQAWDVLRRKVQVGKRVVIVGGGAVGVETGEFIARMGTVSPEVLKFLMTYKVETDESLEDMINRGTKNVTIVEMGKRLGSDIGATTRWVMMDRLRKYGVKMLKLTKVVLIGPDYVEVEGEGGERSRIPADTVVLAAGSRSNNSLFEELKGRVEKLNIVGDAVKPAFVLDAVRAAYDIASTL